MAEYIICSSYLKPSKIEGELPDISYTYIANDSHIGWHYSLTNERKMAYVFDDEEIEFAEFIADCWRMKIKKLF